MLSDGDLRRDGAHGGAVPRAYLSCSIRLPLLHLLLSASAYPTSRSPRSPGPVTMSWQSRCLMEHP